MSKEPDDELDHLAHALLINFGVAVSRDGIKRVVRSS